jgi:ribosomal protein S18 acetylase RimI-like enzyme
MQIEPARADDARAIAEVHVLSWQHAYRDLMPADYLASLAVERRELTWRASLADGQPQLLVARQHEQVVGFVAFGPCRDEGSQPHCAEVWAIYLAPTAWSQGTGRRLWHAALERLVAQGYRTVSLWVLAGNERAIGFYAALGFRPDPATARTFTLGGVPLREVRQVFHAEAQPTAGQVGP